MLRQDKEVSQTSTRNLVRDRDQNPAEHSQVLKQESAQTAKSWKQEKKSESSHSTSTRKVVRGVDSHKNRLEKGFRYMEIRSRQFLEKVYQWLQRKLGTTENLSKFGTDHMKVNILMWRLFMSSSMKAAIHLAPNYSENLVLYKNMNFEEI